VITNGNLFAARGLAPLLRRRRTDWEWQILLTTGLRRPSRGPWTQVPGLLRRWGPRLAAYRLLVVTLPPLLEAIDRRPRTVAGLCRSLDLPIRRCRDIHHPDLRRSVQDFAPDLLLSFSCPYRIREEILAIPRLGGVNVHSSLLPAHAGVGTYLHVLAAGLEVTGVSIHRMEARLDAGPLLAQDQHPIEPGESAFRLFARLCESAGRRLPRLLDDLLRGRGPEGIPQDLKRRSYHGEPDAAVVRRLRRAGHALLRREDVPDLLAPLPPEEHAWPASAR
jgi:hypothetical protein